MIAEPETPGLPQALAPTMADIVRVVERDIGLTPGFLDALQREDDWSMVIKAHALLEAVVAHLVIDALGKPELAGAIGRLPVTGRSSKRSFAKALGILTPEQDMFLEALSALRNDLVHDPRNANQSLQEYVAQLEGKKRRTLGTRLVKALSHGTDPSEKMVFDGQTVEIRDALLRGARFAILMAVMLVISNLGIDAATRNAPRDALEGLRRAMP